MFLQYTQQKTTLTNYNSIKRKNNRNLLLLVQFHVFSYARSINFLDVASVCFVRNFVLICFLSQSFRLDGSFRNQLLVCFLKRINKNLSSLNNYVFYRPIFVIYFNFFNCVQRVQTSDYFSENRMFAIEMSTRPKRDETTEQQ